MRDRNLMKRIVVKESFNKHGKLIDKKELWLYKSKEIKILPKISCDYAEDSDKNDYYYLDVTWSKWSIVLYWEKRDFYYSIMQKILDNLCERKRSE